MIEEQISARLKSERAAIAAYESKKAQEAAANEVEIQQKQVLELQQVLVERDRKLSEAQQAQADLLRKQRELDDAKRELELTIEKRVQASIGEIHIKAKQEAEDALKAQVTQKDTQIAAMNRTIEELKRKAEQGSQQIQGEALELELEGLLRGKFPLDVLEPVGKGEFGGDIVQHVNGAVGPPAGIILWEFKRTKNWSDGWLTKLREDRQRESEATGCVMTIIDPRDRLWAGEAAKYLHLSRSTLAKWRMKDEGPPYHRCGPRLIYYFRHEIDAWLAACDDSLRI